LNPGERFPDLHIGQTTLYHYLNFTKHTILLFTGANSTKEVIEKISQLQKSLENQYPDLIRSFIIHKNKLNISNSILDANGTIHEFYQINKPVMYIIRPDTYILYYSNDLNIESIEKILRTYLY
jgi:hypothetical protein